MTSLILEKPRFSLKHSPGVQLFSFRHEMKRDLEGTLTRLKNMGVETIEPWFEGANFELAQDLKNMNFQVPAIHAPLGSRLEMEKNYAIAHALGADYIVTGSSPGGPNDFADLESIKKFARIYRKEAHEAAACGLRLTYHNHDWEMQKIQGRYAFEYLLEETEGLLAWEWDVYWSLMAGADLHEVQELLKPFCHLLHLKDGDLIKDEKMCALGQGKMPLHDLRDFMTSCNHVFIELDEVDDCIFDLIEQSMKFLKQVSVT
jgi:sugar phosphate isomerase/epimerase